MLSIHMLKVVKLVKILGGGIVCVYVIYKVLS